MVYRNSLQNLLGGVIPAVATLVTIPFIVRELGDANFGVLTMVTAIMGYFAVLDINVTAASVKYVAEYHALQERDRLDQTLSFGLVVYLLIGIVGMVLLYAGSDFIARRLFSVPVTTLPVVADCLRLTALGFLIGQVQTYVQSIPQALQRYDLTAKIEIVFGVLIPVLTVGLLALGYGLYEVVLLRIIAGVLNLAVLLVIARRLLPSARLVWPSGEIARRIGAFSGYAYLSRMAAITYAHLDKLIIGAFVGPTLLTLYVVPATLVGRMANLTNRLGSTFYPAASALSAKNDLRTLEQTYFDVSRYLAFLNVLIALLFMLFAPEILYYWMGERYVSEGAPILRLVAMGMLFDSLTVMPSLLVNGLGHPRVTGVFAITRAALGLSLMTLFLNEFGIRGAASGQLVATVVLASVFLVYVHRRTIPFPLSRLVRFAFSGPFTVGALLLAVLYVVRPPGIANIYEFVVLVSVAVLVSLTYGYNRVMTAAHRQKASAYLHSVAGRGPA